jgi:D-alanyl-D-alanine carboxypeptidase
MRRLSAGLIAFTVVAACGGGVEAPPPSERPVGAAPPIALPRPDDAVAAYLAYRESPFTSEDRAAIEQLERVNVVATASIKEVPVSAGENAVRARVAAVDPVEFRSVAPAPSRDAAFVWAEMSAGEAIATFATADTLGLEDSNRLRIGSQELKVGAYADNGVPNIGDVLVNEAVGRRLGLGEPQWLVVGIPPGSDFEATGKALDRALPDADIVGLLPTTPEVLEPDAPEVVGSVTGSLIGTMSFRVLDDGFIKPDKQWVAENIATATVPLIGEVTCHRLMIPQLSAALAEIEQQGLAQLIRPDDYGGCYVPRFIDRDPSLPLSMHAFGLAVDINVSTNLLGTKGDQDPRVVEIFEKWGFSWGGRWDRPDPMHFELAAIVDTE